MKWKMGTRVLLAAAASVVALFAVGTASAAQRPMVVIKSSVAPVTRTFSFIGRPGSRTSTILNIDGFLVNARCASNGSPIIFGFPQTSTASDLFGHITDGQTRLQIIKDSSFNRTTRGVGLYTSSGDFDSSGSVLFETASGKVVSVNYAFDNATTLNRQNVCTVYGSYVAT